MSSSPSLPHLHRAVSESSGGRIDGGGGRRTLDGGGGGVGASSGETEAGTERSKTAARQHSGSSDSLVSDDDSVASAPPAPSASPGTPPALLTPASRNSVGSRSFGSLEGLASPSPDAAAGIAAANAADDAVGDDGSDVGGVGKVEGNRPRASSRHSKPRGRGVLGLRRRGMSTTDAEVFDNRSSSSMARGFGNRASVGGGVGGAGGGAGGGRVRSWTGGEEAVLSSSVIDNRNVSSSSRRGGGGRRAGGEWGRSRGGLQRISPLWDSEKDGPILQMPVPFDRVGRRWSRRFNVDAAQTGGPLETSGATLGVSVSALTGQFHRTRVVTLYPRLIVRNFLGFPLEVNCLVCVPVHAPCSAAAAAAAPGSVWKRQRC